MLPKEGALLPAASRRGPGCVQASWVSRVQWGPSGPGIAFTLPSRRGLLWKRCADGGAGGCWVAVPFLAGF